MLAPATLEEMTVPAGVDSSAPGWSAYGLGLQVLRVDGRTLVGHGGSMPGFLAGVFVDREEQTGAVSLANTTSRARRRSSSGCSPTCAPPSPGSSSRGRPSPTPVPLDRLGRLVLGPVARTCCARSAAGCCTWARCPGRTGRASRFTPRDDGTWVGLDGYYAGETLRIAEDHLDLGTFIFTRTPYDPDAPVPGGVDERGWR